MLLLALLLQFQLLLLLLLQHSHGALSTQSLLVEAQSIRLAEQRCQLGRIAPVVGTESSLQQIAACLHVEQIAHTLLQYAVHWHPELDTQCQHQVDAIAAAAAVGVQAIPQVVPLARARLLLVGRPWLQAEVLHFADDAERLANLQSKE